MNVRRTKDFMAYYFILILKEKERWKIKAYEMYSYITWIGLRTSLKWLKSSQWGVES